MCLRRALREIDEKTKWRESSGEGLQDEVFRRMVARMVGDEKDDSPKRARDEDEALRRARRAAEKPEAKAADIRDAVNPGRLGGRFGFGAPAGSSLVLTGRVVAKKPAWGSVVGPRGATLSGVVVDVGGEEQTTDAEGRFEIPAAEEGESIEVALVGEATVSAALQVVAARAEAAGPVIETAPDYMVLGDTGKIEGRGLVSSAPESVRARLGEQLLPLLAAHDEELVARIPADAPLGEAALVVENELGTSDAFPVTVIALGLSSTDMTLERGARGTLFVHVEGTEERVRLEVANLTPDVISLEGGASVIVQTSGGPDNRAEVSFIGVTPGDYGISARPLKK
jgi:hypothetical protein